MPLGPPSFRHPPGAGHARHARDASRHAARDAPYAGHDGDARSRALAELPSFTV